MLLFLWCENNRLASWVRLEWLAHIWWQVLAGLLLSVFWWVAVLPYAARICCWLKLCLNRVAFGQLWLLLAIIKIELGVLIVGDFFSWNIKLIVGLLASYSGSRKREELENRYSDILSILIFSLCPWIYLIYFNSFI